MKKFNLYPLAIFCLLLCQAQCQKPLNNAERIATGAERMEVYLHKLQGKSVGLVTNHTSLVNSVHLVDTLTKKGIKIKTIFSPEHGFKGTASDGVWIPDGIEENEGIPIVSLYGKNKKPDPAIIEQHDIIIFDIQDVGARFYTYTSAMTYMMEACASAGIAFMILDRPNPNGHYVDGPTLDPTFRSFVGLHPVPVVHGLTVGEYATMINEEGWLATPLKCDLEVITCSGYDHSKFYSLPVKPSPNLPNMRSVYLYPSLCFFEGTVVSVGRGTNKQFQILGCPDCNNQDGFQFTPVSMPGAKYPPQENKVCFGIDLSDIPESELQEERRLNLGYLVDFYRNHSDKSSFFLKTLFFDKLAGSDVLRKQLEAGMGKEEIRSTWKDDLDRFKELRSRYLLYDE